MKNLIPLNSPKERGIPRIKAKGPETWEIHADRSFNQNYAVGKVVIRTPHQPTSISP